MRSRYVPTLGEVTGAQSKSHPGMCLRCATVSIKTVTLSQAGQLSFAGSISSDMCERKLHTGAPDIYFYKFGLVHSIIG